MKNMKNLKYCPELLGFESLFEIIEKIYSYDVVHGSKVEMWMRSSRVV
jgi:hypothetical protein